MNNGLLSSLFLSALVVTSDLYAKKSLACQVFAKALEEKTFKGISYTPLDKLLSYLPKK